MKLLKNKKQRLYIIALSILAALLVFNGSFFGLLHNMFELKKLNKQTAAIEAEYIKLKTEYDKILQGDTSYIEDTARAKYNMSAKGEIEFRFKTQEEEK
ncbi:MAG: septum formation initiator family protein [Elusimicrobiota bacterium]|jgi:cell division protein FtsB|nr:septum formation initiator family protein [Elusimicrobiota bacterium]